MTEPDELPHFPVHAPPQGIPLAHPTQAKLLMKAIRTMGKVSKPKTRGRRGVEARDTVAFKHKKRFW